MVAAKTLFQGWEREVEGAPYQSPGYWVDMALDAARENASQTEGMDFYEAAYASLAFTAQFNEYLVVRDWLYARGYEH